MPILFHGTSDVFAAVMAGTPAVGAIDVTRGRGEFGRGFYTQDSSGNAVRRAYLLYGSRGAVLVVEIDEAAYHALNVWRLTLNMAQALNARLRAGNAQHAYTTGHDAIVGPLVYQPRIEQQKFQSPNAGILLNGPGTRRTVR